MVAEVVGNAVTMKLGVSGDARIDMKLMQTDYGKFRHPRYNAALVHAHRLGLDLFIINSSPDSASEAE